MPRTAGGAAGLRTETHPVFMNARCCSWPQIARTSRSRLIPACSGDRDVHRGLRIDRLEGHSFVANWLSPGTLVIDCGMNEGRFALGIAERYGCRVIGVEPNVSLAHDNRLVRGLECHHLALTRTAGPVQFHVDETDSTASHVVSGDASAGSRQTVLVPGLPFDGFLESIGSPRVDLLKLDIEGAELDLLDTCPSAVLQRIPQITVEFHAFLDAAQRRPVLDAIARMREVGFYALDFSRNLMNVLFINEALRPVPAIEKARLHAVKYVAGLGRMIDQQRR